MILRVTAVMLGIVGVICGVGAIAFGCVAHDWRDAPVFVVAGAIMYGSASMAFARMGSWSKRS